MLIEAYRHWAKPQLLLGVYTKGHNSVLSVRMHGNKYIVSVPAQPNEPFLWGISNRPCEIARVAVTLDSEFTILSRWPIHRFQDSETR